MGVYTLQNSVDFAKPFIEYVPLVAGIGSEPAISIGTMVRNTILGAPFVWGWNRNENSATSTVSGTQDYTLNITDFGYLEKVSLTDAAGNVWEVKDVYNTCSLGPGSATLKLVRPSSVAVKSVIYGTSVTIRFMGVPDAVYVITVTYQSLPINFAQFSVSVAANASAGNTVYTGVFTPASFPTGSLASISGFVTHVVNNGTFVVVSCTGSTLTLANPAGVAETVTASAINQSWAPIPDHFMSIFNNLFLGEAFQAFDDARGQIYRQRGVLQLLAKAEGLDSMTKNIFLTQFLNRDSQITTAAMRSQQGNAARQS